VADLWRTLGYDQVALDVAAGLAESSDVHLIKGPPGVGKSRLAKGIGAMWETSGGAVLVAEGDPMRTDVPLHPFGIAMGGLKQEDYAALKAAASVLAKAGELLLGTGGLLTTAIEALARYQRERRGVPTILLDQKEQEVVFRLTKACRRKPLLLVADNLHWWDVDSLALLHRLRNGQLGESYPQLREMRILAVETTEPHQQVAHPKAHDTFLPPGQTEVFPLPPVPGEAFVDVLEALGAPRPPQDVADLIFNLSGGHLLLASRCASRLREDEAESFLVASSPDDFVQKVLSERVRNLGSIGEEATGILKVAAVSGLTFREEEIGCAAQLDEARTSRLFRHCHNEKILELDAGVARFVHDFYRQFFLDSTGLEREGIHELLGDCLRKISPGDYVTRCLNAKYATQTQKAATLAVHAALQRQREGMRWQELPVPVLDAMKDEALCEVTERFESAFEYLKQYRTTDCLHALSGLSHDLAPSLSAEEDYLRATCLMVTRSEKDRAEADALLESWSDYVEEEPEVGLRLMRLRLYHMALRVDKHPGQKLEAKIRRILRQRSGFDPAAKDALYSLDRCAGSFHKADRALDWKWRAVKYFEPGDENLIPRRPVEYYLSLVNYGASLFTNGEYAKAHEVHETVLNLIDAYEENAFPRVDYPRMNALLTELRRGAIDIDEAVQRQREIVALYRAPDDPFFIDNALGVYLLLAGSQDEAMDLFDRLAKQLAGRQDPEPAMVYLIRGNRCAARFVSGDRDGAVAEWDELGDVVARIPYITRDSLIRRHEMLAAVMRDCQPMSAKEFDECLLDKAPTEFSALWRHHGRGFRLPAVEWWR
jgi:tetratricopeptide (TPR) repeat protein